MKHKNVFVILLATIVFCALVGYNYAVAQRRLKETKAAPLSISLLSYPETLLAGQTGTFIWNIDSTPDLSTPQTTIFWGYIASPSALTMSNSPEAVGYPNRQEDYWHGLFRLPDTFDTSITFDKPGVVYFRAYAKVGDNYLWTDENSIEIKPIK